MGFIKARDSHLYHGDKGEGPPIVLTHPAAFRETAHRRVRRQAATLVRAARAGRARAKSDPLRHVAPVDAAALRDLVATVAADARLVRVPVNQPPWTPTGLAVTAGDHVSWLAWGSPHLVAGSTRNDRCSPTTRPRSAGRRPRVWSASGSSRKPSLKQATRPVNSGESSPPTETRSYACSDRAHSHALGCGESFRGEGPLGEGPMTPAPEDRAVQASMMMRQVLARQQEVRSWRPGLSAAKTARPGQG
jgi:plastocyanin